MNTAYFWSFLPWGYLFTVAVETPILAVGLSRRHPLSHRLIAGLWLTACTYPIVVLVLPALMLSEGYSRGDYWLYIAVAEIFAPLAECVLFWLAYGANAERGRGATARDMAAIIAANLASFGLGVWVFSFWRR